MSHFVIIIVACSSEKAGKVVLQNRHFKYVISQNGKNLSFIDRESGADYLSKEKESWCASVTINGDRKNVQKVSTKGNFLHLEFEHPGVTADILIEKGKDRIKFTVKEVTGNPESLTFLNIPLKLEGMPYEPFAACALSMNLFTHVRQIPALQTHLWAACYARFGFKDAQVMILGVPEEKILPLIRDVMTHSKDIPFSDKGGAWALQQEEGYGSYLMNFGTLTESTVDEWIKMCQNLGFNQIDNHGGGNFFRFGEFELNREKWPDGWHSFRKINEKLHSAGISSIFHTYAFFIDKNSRYVTPEPHKDLAFWGEFTLSEPLKIGDSEIIVNEPTTNISTVTGFFVRNSTTLRIGNELIEFSGVSKSPPYKFTGCRRGALGTKESIHAAGDKAFHMRETLGRFVPDPDTELFNEIAHRHAEIVNQCKFDGIYFDAIDGADILGGDENFWYYGTKFIFEIAKHLDHPIGMEMSSMSHHWWHYRSRWQAWDRPVRGYKRFIDIHSAAIKATRLFMPEKMVSNENEHGRWRGHAPLIQKYAGIDNGSLMLPLHLGWWGNQVWNPPQIEPTFTDDIEYLCCKLIGNNAGLSMLGDADEKTLAENPLFSRLVPIIRQYEELRHSNYFSDSIRTLLRQPGKEFRLFIDSSGKWNLKPATYDKHKITGNDDPSSQWISKNEFSPQSLKVRIQPLMSVKSYTDQANITIADFAHRQQFEGEGAAEGVSGSLQQSDENNGNMDNNIDFKALSDSKIPREGRWIKFARRFNPWLDLSKNQGLGVWVKGDGNGEIINLRLESPSHLSHGAHGDHFIKIDFKGWKYFELVEIESSEYSNYIWPDSGFYVYDSYRHTIQFNNINKLQIWYNNLPADKEVKCVIGKIKALPLVSAHIKNPSLTINDQKVTFLTEMEPGMVLEFNSKEDCKLYGPKGEFLKDVKIEGLIPILNSGENKILYSSVTFSKINTRAQVTLICEGEPLIK